MLSAEEVIGEVEAAYYIETGACDADGSDDVVIDCQGEKANMMSSAAAGYRLFDSLPGLGGAGGRTRNFTLPVSNSSPVSRSVWSASGLEPFVC